MTPIPPLSWQVWVVGFPTSPNKTSCNQPNERESPSAYGQPQAGLAHLTVPSSFATFAYPPSVDGFCLVYLFSLFFFVFLCRFFIPLFFTDFSFSFFFYALVLFVLSMVSLIFLLVSAVFFVYFLVFFVSLLFLSFVIFYLACFLNTCLLF